MKLDWIISWENVKGCNLRLQFSSIFLPRRKYAESEVFVLVRIKGLLAGCTWKGSFVPLAIQLLTLNQIQKCFFSLNGKDLTIVTMNFFCQSNVSKNTLHRLYSNSSSCLEVCFVNWARVEILPNTHVPLKLVDRDPHMHQLYTSKGYIASNVSSVVEF